MYCLPPLDDEVFVEGLEATVHLLLPVPGTLEQLRTRFFISSTFPSYHYGV